MRTFFIPILLLASPLITAEETRQTAIRYGERPQDSVFDPAELLTSRQRTELAAPLAEVRDNEGLDVMIVILPDLGDAPPEHVAEGFAVKWGTTKVNAVVLHVPDRADSPWIFPGRVMGDLLSPEILRNAVQSAQKRARAEPTDFAKVRIASNEASDILRFWMGRVRIYSEEIIHSRSLEQKKFEDRRRLIKLAYYLAVASLIPLILVAVILVLWIRNSRPLHFPSVSVTPRLGAPHSGGSHAVF